MILALKRPLVTLDVETHDKFAPESSRIVEIGFKMLHPDGREPKRWRGYVNPRVPISKDATAIHGITNEDVEAAPSFSQLAANIAKGFTDCDYAGYNVRFDLRVVDAEMRRAGVAWSYAGARLIDALRLWQIVEPRSLEDATERWLKRKARRAHRALEDAEDALDVALEILQQRRDLPRDVEKLHDLCFPRDPNWIDSEGKLIWVGDAPCVNFGKHKGKNMAGLDDYLSWMLRADFSVEVKNVIERFRRGELKR